MATRGAESKNIVTKKILDIFEGAFQYDKEIRIPLMENGELIQIKVTLTAAKTNVEEGADNAIPQSIKTEQMATLHSTDAFTEQVQTIMPTEEEKENVKNLLASFGL